MGGSLVGMAVGKARRRGRHSSRSRFRRCTPSIRFQARRHRSRGLMSIGKCCCKARQVPKGASGWVAWEAEDRTGCRSRRSRFRRCRTTRMPHQGHRHHKCHSRPNADLPGRCCRKSPQAPVAATEVGQLEAEGTGWVAGGVEDGTERRNLHSRIRKCMMRSPHQAHRRRKARSRRSGRCSHKWPRAAVAATEGATGGVAGVWGGGQDG